MPLAEARTERAECERNRRDEQQQHEPTAEIVAHCIRRQIARTAVMKVADETCVVWSTGVRIGDGHPDCEDE